ncbi:LysR family transcriptional regulator [Variovorax sp. J22G73]|uniref:LysR family transcriptional regulator n=1 Tax=unclassified Variovorax TaxID=663243 RepID=UPI0025756856|nr:MULTISPECIES: LysR family transcriptional regulator [unclassified Variovorax]MDM0004669.1 LysR family transcriptional regulator [Variovorax sp. J22R203]MDM0095665.1 LysR family transcriptional regulator [Variovorax sp. J22G73]
MDRFDAMRLFTRIVELGSFTQAAAALDMPRATATHAIKELEARLHVRLLVRTTRQVRTTVDGQAYYERCRHLLRELEDAESSLAELSINPRGRLRIDIHGAPANELVLPRIGEFHARYPHIELAVGSGDRLVDLVREGVDCVVRAGEPKDSSLVTRRLALIPQVTVASPAYLAANGTPLQPADLARHWAVNFFSASRTDFFPFDFEVDGRAETHMLRSWISVNSADSYKTCAEQGCGIIQVPRFHVERQLRAGTLVEILAHTPCPPMVYSVLYPHHRQLSPRVRVFIDWVTQLYDECFGPR